MPCFGCFVFFVLYTKVYKINVGNYFLSQNSGGNGVCTTRMSFHTAKPILTQQ